MKTEITIDRRKDGKHEYVENFIIKDRQLINMFDRYDVYDIKEVRFSLQEQNTIFPYKLTLIVTKGMVNKTEIKYKTKTNNFYY